MVITCFNKDSSLNIQTYYLLLSNERKRQIKIYNSDPC